MPALRDRSEDIPLLINHFIKKYSVNTKENKSFDKDALNELKDYHWPGNVRELENLIKRIIILVPQNLIDKDTLNLLCLSLKKIVILLQVIPWVLP